MISEKSEWSRDNVFSPGGCKVIQGAFLLTEEPEIYRGCVSVIQLKLLVVKSMCAMHDWIIRFLPGL